MRTIQGALIVGQLMSAGQTYAASAEAEQYMAVRKEYEQYRCEQVKLMRAQGDAANGEDMAKAKEFYEQRVKLMTSAQVQKLEEQLRELRQKLMMAKSGADYEAISAFEGEVRQTCRH
jgi:CRISPR/Cas system-associated endonuclease Cas1